MEQAWKHSSTNDGYWREYRLGPVAEAAHVTTSTLVACAVGLGLSFASLLLVGVAGEEELVVGYTEFIDELTRASLDALLSLGVLFWSVFVVADSVRSVSVSKALVRAAERDADPRAVPHPAQIESVVLSPHLQLKVFLGILGSLAALVAGVGVGERDTVLTVTGAVVALACAAGFWATHAVAGPAHLRRRRLVAEHWTAHHEQTAWGHARNRSGTRRGRTSSEPADGSGATAAGKLGRGTRLMVVGAMSGTLSAVVLELFLFVRFPGSVSTPGATLNERGSFSNTVEAALDGAVWVAAFLGLAGIVIALIGSVVAAAGLSDERDDLVERLDDPSASRPDDRLLARHAERSPAGLALIGAGFGSFVLVPSLGVLAVLSRGSDDSAETAELFSRLHPYAVGGALLGVLLVVSALVANTVVNLRDHPVRDRLQQRWPVLPKKPDDKESKRYAVRTRPTLRREDL